MKRVVLPVLALLIVAVAFCAFGSIGVPFWTVCLEVEKKVDSGQFQIGQVNNAWFIFTPKGFAQTGEYLGHFAGLLAKRAINDPSGREAFKLAGICGGSDRVSQWASAKGLGPDGQKLPRTVVLPKLWPVDKGRLPGDRGGPVFEFAIGGLLIVGIIMVRLHRRRRFAFGS